MPPTAATAERVTAGARRIAGPETDYHALNAMLNLYDADGKIQFDKDREAAHQYFLQHVNQNTVFFHNQDEKLDYLIARTITSVRFSTSTRATSSRPCWTARMPRSSGSRRSWARSSTTPPTR